MKHVIVIDTVDPEAGGHELDLSFQCALEGEIEDRVRRRYGICLVHSRFNVKSAIGAVHEMYGAPKWDPYN
jgi:hypothetical protein